MKKPRFNLREFPVAGGQGHASQIAKTIVRVTHRVERSIAGSCDSFFHLLGHQSDPKTASNDFDEILNREGLISAISRDQNVPLTCCETSTKQLLINLICCL